MIEEKVNREIEQRDEYTAKVMLKAIYGLIDTAKNR